MLTLLRRIVQEVNAAHDFSEALQIMVVRVREAISTKACTVFLLDHRMHQYVLMATEGLNPKAIGKVKLNLDEGLIGLIGQREEPINLEDAPSHPSFLYHPEVGEEPYKAFLGVPIIHHRRLLGVLIVQQEEQRRFDESEEAFLVTMSAQLAGVIAHAEATGVIANLFDKINSVDSGSAAGTGAATLMGIAAVPGIGIGTSVVVYPSADLEAVPDRAIAANEIAAEIALFDTALAAAKEDIRALSERLIKTLPEEERALFDVYLRILDSATLRTSIVEVIQQGNWAQGALRQIVRQHIRQFEAMEDHYLRERGVDFKDLGHRILLHLQESQQVTHVYPENTILVGEEVTVSNLAEVPEGRLRGLISAKGSSNSHVAILARALGAPTVMGVDGLLPNSLEGKPLIVDGYHGQIYIAPTPELLQEFTVLAQQEQALHANLDSLHDLPAQTPDGHNISLLVNIGLALDAGLSLTAGAEGVGLYRTEVPFMIRDRFPAEEEQRVIYHQLLRAFAPRPVIMRTLDIGGDKALPYFPVKEDNPFLGWRGIRITLDHPEVFLVQVRAMLRASMGLDNLHIMLPMVTSVAEVEEAVSLLIQAYHEVVEEGAPIKMPLIGVMIEVPSAVYQARALAKRVDFLSVGSNDLTQYLLAVDRNNARVANLYDSLHPAVLQALIQVAQGARYEKKKVSICGEMAGDPAAVILLMAMGYDALSMNPSSLPRIKWVIRNFSIHQAQRLLNEALEMDCPALIRFHLERALEQAGLGGLVNIHK